MRLCLQRIPVLAHPQVRTFVYILQKLLGTLKIQQIHRNTCDQLNDKHTNGECHYNNAVQYNQILHTSLRWLEAQYKWELEPPKDTPARPTGCLWSHAIVNQNPKSQWMSINSKCQFNTSMLFKQCMIILTIEIKIFLAWRRCPTYSRDVVSYCYLRLCNLCRPPWLTSSGVAPECLLNGFSCLIWSLQRELCLFWSYTISDDILP